MTPSEKDTDPPFFVASIAHALKVASAGVLENKLEYGCFKILLPPVPFDDITT
jgi:hypothetical protein